MNFTNISAHTLHRSIEKMNVGGQFTDGANFLTHTKWDNLKTGLSKLLSFFLGTKNRQDNMYEKMHILESMSTNFAIDILKLDKGHGNSDRPEYFEIALRSDDPDLNLGEGMRQLNIINFVETPRGNLIIRDQNNVAIATSIKFADLQVLALKELLDKANATGSDSYINIDAIPNFDKIRDKFIEKFGNTERGNLDARCKAFNFENMIVNNVGPDKTTLEKDADIAWAQAGAAIVKERVLSRMSTPLVAG
jgi:hypothetical protein